MRMDRWSEGLVSDLLQEAYEKDVKNPETLANLVSASLLSGKSSTRHVRYEGRAHNLSASLELLN